MSSFCNQCNKKIIETPTQWWFWHFHYDCYLERTKPLQNFIDEINITLGMKALMTKDWKY